MFDAALSTMWGIGRFQGLSGFFAAAKELGFGRIELNHAISTAMLDEVDLDGLCIASVHEPCPADPSMATLKERDWLVSAADEENREKGVAAVRRSIDYAARVGAPVVIVHPGQVDVDPALESALRDLYNQGRSGEPEYARARESLKATRAARAEPAMRSVRRSLLELADHAAGLNVRLGLENRYHYHEIPRPDELEQLLTMGCGEVVGYWHDVGHAEALEKLGFDSHEDWLRRFGERIVGVHLHDIAGIQDHQAPGRGTMDWDLVARHLPAAALRTCEFQNFNSPQEVAAGITLLIEKGCMVKL